MPTVKEVINEWGNWKSDSIKSIKKMKDGSWKHFCVNSGSWRGETFIKVERKGESYIVTRYYNDEPTKPRTYTDIKLVAQQVDYFSNKHCGKN